MTEKEEPVLLPWVAVSSLLVGVVAALATKGMVALLGRCAGQQVSRILTDAEYIVEHRAVPPAWLEKLRKNLSGLHPECTNARLKARHQARARRWCLREIERLLSFARTTSIVADEGTREILVSELSRVREQWRTRSWGKMCAGSEAA